MALLLILLLEALFIAALLIWVTLLTLRATGRIGPRRGGWSTKSATQQELTDRHPRNR